MNISIYNYSKYCTIFFYYYTVSIAILQFVCMGGTPKRMEEFAYHIMKEIGHKLPCGTTLLDISQYSYRYSMYKVGPVLCVSVSIQIFFCYNFLLH